MSSTLKRWQDPWGVLAPGKGESSSARIFSPQEEQEGVQDLVEMLCDSEARRGLHLQEG